MTCLPAGRPDRETQPKLVARKVGHNYQEGNRKKEEKTSRKVWSWPVIVHRARRDEGKMTIKNFDRRDGFEIFPRTHLLVINCGANENALSNQDVHAPFGNLSFDLLDSL